MDNHTPQISIQWRHHRRASLKQQERGKQAALAALSAGRSSQEAACALIDAMFAGRRMLFADFRVLIDGQRFD